MMLSKILNCLNCNKPFEAPEHVHNGCCSATCSVVFTKNHDGMLCEYIGPMSEAEKEDDSNENYN